MLQMRFARFGILPSRLLPRNVSLLNFQLSSGKTMLISRCTRGLGCLGTPIVRSDAASVWSTGVTWYQIPPIAKIFFTGSLPIGVTVSEVSRTLSKFLT